MTQTQLDRAVAARHRRVPPHRSAASASGRLQRLPDDVATRDLRLAVDCPFCGRAVRVPRPGRRRAAARWPSA